AMAVPAYQATINGNALRATSAALVSALNIARSQAVNLRGDIKVEAINGKWEDGWQLKYPTGTPEDDQSFVPHSKASVSLASGAHTSITFNSLGVATPELEFLVCLDGEAASGRKITVSRFGKVENELHSCN